VSGGVSAIGGYHWGTLFLNNCQCDTLGRAEGAAVTADSTVYRGAVNLLAARFNVVVPVLHSNAGGGTALTVTDDGSANYGTGSTGTVFDGSFGGSFCLVDRRSHLNLFVSITASSGAAAASSTSGVPNGMITLGLASECDIRGAVTLGNSSTRQLLVCHPGSVCRVNSAGSLTSTGSGGIEVNAGATFQNYGAVTTSGGQIVNNGGNVDMNANVTIGTAPGIPFRSIGGQVTQRAGILSCVASAGDGLRAEAGARVRLRSGLNTVLTGVGASNVGCRAKGGALVTFDGAPTSVTGPSSADLSVDGVAEANTVLGAEGAMITDMLSTIGRVA
jgi:hypothetical protein